MNYHKIYNAIIIKRKQNYFNGYTENHHIIPKSLGGTDDKENLVELSAREHFICHLLLTKMYPEGSVEWIKMCKAFMNMFRQGNHKRYCPSKWYEYCRIQTAKAASLNQSGSGNSQYGKRWIYNPTTKEVKHINLNELEYFLQKGWIRGKSKSSKCNQIDSNGKYIKLTKIQKELNKQNRKEKKKGKIYQVTNKITKEKRFVTEEELLELDDIWVSLYYKVDKQKVKELFKQGYKIQQIADYFNMSYHNFYSWYKPYRKQIQLELKEVFNKTRICPICGKEFPLYPERVYCSKECMVKAFNSKVWIKKEQEVKHINKQKLQEYLDLGWKQVNPIPGKPSSQWK